VTEREREARRLRLLLSRLEDDRQTAAAVHDRLRQAEERLVASAPDPVTVAAVALYLQNLYTALEEVLRRLAAELDGTIPAGEDWHRELLGQMALDVGGVRPRVIDENLHADLDHLRRFRHVVRHAYAADYDWSEMQSAVAAAHRVMEAFPGAMADIEQTVLAAIRECERPD